MGAEGFGKRVRELREAAGLSQASIEARMGKAQRSGYLSNVERGARDKRPSSELIETLVAMTGASRAWLLDGQGPMMGPGDAATRPAAMPERTIEREDQFGSRAQFVIAARAKGADETVLQMMLAEAREHRLDGKDPGIEHWRAEYKRLAEELAGIGKDIDELRAVTDLDDEETP